MTLQTESHGQLPIPPEILQQLSPEQRAGLEKKMKGQNNQPDTF
jgi:hypothetical protein